MEVKVKIRTLTIKNNETGKAFTVRTLRTTEDVAAYVEESEKDEIVSRLEDAVNEAYAKDTKDK